MSVATICMGYPVSMFWSGPLRLCAGDFLVAQLTQVLHHSLTALEYPGQKNFSLSLAKVLSSPKWQLMVPACASSNTSSRKRLGITSCRW